MKCDISVIATGGTEAGTVSTRRSASVVRSGISGRSAAEELAAGVAGALREAGTRVVYGMPGGGNNLEVIEAAEAAGLRFVLAHAETAAAIMASVDGELNRVPGACVVTRGPGASSVVNGVAQALLDRAPVAVITDAVGWHDRARVPHQRLDQAALLGSVSKWSGTISVNGVNDAVAAALALAVAPAPGPVHLDFVPDAPATDNPIVDAQVHRYATADVRRILAASRSPVFALGVGARGYVPVLRELLAGKPWPVLTTYKAKGAIPELWENAAGLLTGGAIESPVLRAADLIVAVGLDPVELIPAPWPYAAPVLALGEWPVGEPYFAPAYDAVGPLDDLLAIVDEALPVGFGGPSFGRASRIASEVGLVDAPAEGIAPQDVVVTARKRAPSGAIATVDSGAHMLVAMPLWEVKNLDEALISSGLATMGFSLPAAIAASIARPDRHVICFTGDGGLGMTLAELETVARLDAAITIVVFNDAALSLIKIKQKPGGHGGENAVRYKETDFAAIAASVGIASRRVDSRRALDATLVEALSERRPFLLDVAVDPRGYSQIMATIRGGSRA